MRIKKVLSLFMAMIMTLTLMPANVFAASGSSSPTLTKTAEWVDQEKGLAKITMTAKGTPVEVTGRNGADVLLVLDASGSMTTHPKTTCRGDLELKYDGWWGDYYYKCSKCESTYDYYAAPSNLKCTQQTSMGDSRWEIAQEAAEELIDQVVPDEKTDNRMGVILFSADGRSNASSNNVGNHSKAIKNSQDFTKDSEAILDACQYNPSGGTDYTGALQKAYDLIDSRSDKSRPVYLVFLSDGAPGGYTTWSGSYDRIGEPNWDGSNEITNLKSTSDGNDVTIYTVGFGLTDSKAINLLEGYASDSSHAYNITDGGELSGLFAEIGNTIASGVSVWDTIDTSYFTLTNRPDTNKSYFVSDGTVQCSNNSQFVWNMDNFSQSGETLEIYIQLKSEYLNKNGNYPTNKSGSAYGEYVGSDGDKIDLPVSTTNGSSPIPTLNAKAKDVKVQFQFVGNNKDKANFNDPLQANQTVAIGGKVTKPVVTVADGYEITDWYTTGDCTGTAFDFATAISENRAITLFARVDEDADAKFAYSVEFYKNGVKAEEVPGSVWAGNPSITVAQAEAMKKGNYANYSFTEAKVGQNQYTQGTDKIEIQKNGNTVIKVFYTSGTVELTFQIGEHGKFSALADKDKASVKRTTQYDASFSAVPDVTAELGWKAVGWYESGDGAMNIVPFPQTVTEAKTYIMKYEKNDSDWKAVTFLKNDGTTAQHKVVDEILVGSNISAESWPSNPDRAGYKFIGWFTMDGTNGNWGSPFSQSTKVSDSMSVYAKWEKTVTDVPVAYYLGSISGTELTFSDKQKVSNATIDASYAEYITDALKEKGKTATNLNEYKYYYEVSNAKADVYINGAELGTQTVKDGDTIQVVYPAKIGSFRVWEYFLASDVDSNYGQYLKQYESTLVHGSELKYGEAQTDLTIAEVNKILSASLDATKSSNPGAKLKSVYIDYQKVAASGDAAWQTPISATLNSAGTAVETFEGLDEMIIHGGCETRLTISYELPVEVRVEYHKQYGDTNNYYKIEGKDYVIGEKTSYVYKNDFLSIVENANSNKTINKVIPDGVEGYQVSKLATAQEPTKAITADSYKITQPTTFIVFLDAITAQNGKIVNVDTMGAALEGGEFVFNDTALTANNENKNEHPITQKFVYGVEYTVKQTKSALGYNKADDFKVKLKADGSGLELVGTVQNVTVNGMTITVQNQIDTNQKFGYTVNRYIKGTTTPVKGFTENELSGSAPLGTFTWTNLERTTTGYKLVTTPAQPTSMMITTDATKNTANVYYEVDDSQTRSYKVTYWKDGEKLPFDTKTGLTVLEANPIVAYESIAMDNVPTGYELKGVLFGSNAFMPKENVTITSTDNEIKVIYQKQANMWFDVNFLAGGHGTLNGNESKVEWLQVLKDTTVETLGGIPTVTAANGYEFIGWSTDNGATLIQPNELPQTITKNATYTAQWTQVYNLKYYVFEKKDTNDTTITAKYNSNEEAAEAVAAHIPHNSAQYSNALFEGESKISDVDLAKFAASTTPDDKDRTETADAKFATLIREYKDSQALNAEYKAAPGYDVVPFRLVQEGSVVHVDCYLVKNATDWTKITFDAGEYGKWADGSTASISVDAIKGAKWSDYASNVPAKPVQSEIGWKLADEVQIWDKAIPADSSTIPGEGLIFTAMWVEDTADVSFQLQGITVDGTEQFFGAIKPETQSIQKGKTASDPTTATIANIEKGYTFVGWFTDSTCTVPFEFTSAITEDTTLYGKVVVKEGDWATVIFKADSNGMLNDGGDDIDTIETNPILLGNTIGRSIPTAKANVGFEFDAWYKVTETETGATEVKETPSADTVVNSNLTYLAKFAQLLKVSFNVNTTKAVEGTESVYENKNISRGTKWDTIEVPTVVGKLRENVYSHDYKFVGWGDESFPETITTDLNYTAQFDDIYTFVVEHANLNAGSAYPNASINYFKHEAGDAISSAANPAVRGYELSNITVYVGEAKQEVATTAELIQKLKELYNITLTEDGTLSGAMPEDCIWIKYGYEKLAERAVLYVSEGTVTGMPENMTERYKGDEITVSTVEPKRDGYNFGGWEVVEDIVTITDGKFIMPDGNVTLKAIWSPNEEVWNYTVEHYLDGVSKPFASTTESVLKREPNVDTVVLNAPQGYKFKEYQVNGDSTNLPVSISDNGTVISVIYETNDLIVKHVYGDSTVYDTTQSKADVEDGKITVNAVNSGRYTRLRSVTVNGDSVALSRNVVVDFTADNKYEVVFVYGRRSTDTNEPTTPDDNKDFGEEVTIIEEEVPLADGLNMIDHFAYIFGYEDDTVRPMNRISREEVAAIFYRLLNDAVRESFKTTEHNFPDVSSQRWSNKSIATLTNGEILAGYPTGEFKPGNAITRAEFAVIVSKFDSLSKAETNMFKDIESHWAKDFINSAALKGWISGYPDGTFHPNDYITRAEAMTLINSVLSRKVSKEGLLEDAKYWTDNKETAWYYEAVMEATNSHDYTKETADGVETWTAMKPDKTWD